VFDLTPRPPLLGSVLRTLAPLQGSALQRFGPPPSDPIRSYLAREGGDPASALPQKGDRSGPSLPS